MIAVALSAGLCLICMAAGWLLFRRTRYVVAASDVAASSDFSIIIPARDEARSLPILLASIRESSLQPAEILVVDDESTDGTAEVARRHGAVVVASAPRPEGWRGKPWACWQGAQHAESPLLLFLDADTRFAVDGLKRLREMYGAAGKGLALSVLPYSRMEKLFEELSLFFNLMLAGGAGGFRGDSPSGLFGQSLLIERELYFKAGGHEVVRQHVLENFHLASHVKAAGGQIETALGRGVLEMRMFPDGMEQLCSSWTKGFADGAKTTPAVEMMLSVAWLTGAVLSVIALCAGVLREEALVLYGLYAMQVWVLGRRVGMYRWFTALLYVLPLGFYFVLFAGSVFAQHSGREVAWKGRKL